MLCKIIEIYINLYKYFDFNLFLFSFFVQKCIQIEILFLFLSFIHSFMLSSLFSVSVKALIVILVNKLTYEHKF